MTAIRDVWVRVALLAAAASVVYFLVAALGTRFGLFDWRFGFGRLTMGLGPPILMGVAAFAALGAVLSVAVRPRRGAFLALVALAIPLAGIGYGALAAHRAAQLPPLHDISTDLTDPPGFSAQTVAAREAVPGVNSLDLVRKRVPEGATRWPWAAGRLSLELQAEHYPDIATIAFAGTPEQALAAAEAAARASGWEIVRVDPQAGDLEARQTSFWFGFVDDIVIRVRPSNSGGALIDVRSVSRVGLSDLGANAARIRAFRGKVAERA